ncbi:23S rRNA (uracil(1939)-C(5))-methyltransferase RlmD [Thermoflavimicrobium daqui]|uniref:23S rRNA (Uracil(1939)-C(5))-methyltransferase RlmD n=1 Tax=Thermoflavimicrobium daqui TaxID=2137476 RepID=A0A364K4Y5_9BACL|nr:23S rRNA (uracil(1939)-C(5))-methyltransferase RlmD [Thermoflavimicrobium daqui]RAL24329.1 23S rRNA (uracil(1939)-C(5))-methyltransferase RlmD [Thermoflavimicrobium daqui]
MRTKKKIHLHKGQIVELPIRRLGINGEGVGYYQKQVIFVEGAIPGEFVVARIDEVEKNFAKAKLVRLKKKSAYRIQPKCPIYETCGGCQLQHIDYRFQRRLKRELVQEAFRKYTNLADIPIEKTISMSEPWTYRNKAQFPLQSIEQRVVMGMFSAKSHRLVEIKECPVQHPLVNQALEIVRDIIEQLKISIYDERKHQGVIRHIVVRISFATKEIQLVFISRTKSFPEEKALISEVIKRLPQVKSIVLNHNPHKTSLIFGNESRLLWGTEKISEQLGEITYLLSARAFFQLNPVQTRKLYEEVEKLAQLTGNETVIDAYCGVGTIGIWLARKAKRVLGMDTIPEAIENAKENAVVNQIDHAEYVVGEAEILIPKWVKKGLKPDLVVVDPPRVGLGQALIDTLLEVKVPRMIYVSCNPATLAKDCQQLIRGGYQVKKVIPLDMFPQTAHIESITLLEREVVT